VRKRQRTDKVKVCGQEGTRASRLILLRPWLYLRRIQQESPRPKQHVHHEPHHNAQLCLPSKTGLESTAAGAGSDIRENNVFRSLDLAPITPESGRLGIAQEEQGQDGEEKPHDDAPENHTLRRRLDERCIPHAVHGIDPLLFQRPRVLVIYRNPSSPADATRNAHTILVVFDLDVEIVGRRLAVKLPPKVGYIFL
jgi:hypothetical protein